MPERSPTERSPTERSPTERSPTERSPTERSPTERSSTHLDGFLKALPWQAESWSRLQRAFGTDSVPHALLLSGTVGIGKAHFGNALTALLLCHNPGNDLPCGRCRSCHLLQVGSHSDHLLLQPEGKSRAIKIDQVRTLIEFVNQTPGLGKRKVVLIHPAETLNLNAANALLKCLEEPSRGTYFILVSHVSSSLPATIRSRCQLLTMPEPTPEQSRSWLDQFTGSADISKALLAVTNGQPTAALTLFKNGGLVQQQELQDGLDALVNGQILAIEFPRLVAELDLGVVLGLFSRRLQTSIRASAEQQSANQRQQFLLLDELHRLQRAVLHGGNPNRQLTIENCAAQLARVLGPG
jgi:DNA polymerase-3 subunit delta'